MLKNLKELLFLHFLNDGVRTTFVVILPFIAKDLSINYAQVGILGSSQALFATILALPAGFLVSRIGGFHVLLYVLLIYSLASIGVSFSPSILLLIPAFYLGAIGFGMFHTIGFTIIAKISGKTNIGRNMGDFTSIGDIGRIALPPLAIFSTSLLGWRLTMAGIGIIGFIAYILFRSKASTNEVYSFKDNSIIKESPKDFIKNALLLLKDKKFFSVVLASIIDSLASSPVYIYLPFLLLSKGISPAQLGFIMGAFFVGSLFGKSVLGRITDKIGNAKVFMLSEFCMSVILITITFFSMFFIFLFLSFLLGIFTKGTSPVVQTMFSALTHHSLYNKVYVVSEISIGMSATLITVLMGLIADSYGIRTVFYLCSLLGIFAIFPVYFYRTAQQKKTDGIR